MAGRAIAGRRLSLVLASISLAGLLAGCSKVEQMLGQKTAEAPPPSLDAPAEEEPRMLGRIGDFSRVLALPPPEAPPSPLPLDYADAADTPSPEGEVLPSGTSAGEQALAFAAELDRLKAKVDAHTAEHEQVRGTTAEAVDQFRAAVASIGPGAEGAPSDQPAHQQLAEADARLNDVSDGITQMEALRSRILADAQLANSLAEQAQLAGESADATGEDRRQLQRLEEEAQQTEALFEALLDEVDGEILRQSDSVSRERRGLTELAMTVTSAEPAPDAGAEAGAANEPASAAVIPPSPERKAAALQSAARPATRTPLVAIPFGPSDPDYEPGLYVAISEAVARNPFASFEVVAVSSGARPGATLAAARRNAERVAQSLINMGVPEGRLKQSATTTDGDGADEVRVYMM